MASTSPELELMIFMTPILMDKAQLALQFLIPTYWLMNIPCFTILIPRAMYTQCQLPVLLPPQLPQCSG